MHAGVVRDIVAVIAQRRWEERKQPDAGYAQVLKVIQLLREAFEIAHAVVVAVKESFDVGFIDDGVFVPQRIAGAACLHRFSLSHSRNACTWAGSFTKYLANVPALRPTRMVISSVRRTTASSSVPSAPM